MESELLFDEHTHTYTYKGSKIAHTTGILQPLYGDAYKGVDAALLEASKQRGKDVHALAENYFKTGNFNLTGNQHPHAYGLLDWINETDLDLSDVISEGRYVGVYNDLVYGGSIDIVGRDFILDFKTREVKKKLDLLQLILYRNFRAEWGAKRLIVVSLLKDGKYKETELTDMAWEYETWVGKVLMYLTEMHKMKELGLAEFKSLNLTKEKKRRNGI